MSADQGAPHSIERYEIAVITKTPQMAERGDVWEADVITSWWRAALVRLTGNKRWYWRWTSGPTVIGGAIPNGNLAHGSGAYLDTSDDSKIDWTNLPDDWEGAPARRVGMVHGHPVMTPVFSPGEILFLSPETEREITGMGRKPRKWFVEYEYVDTLDEAIALSRKVSGYEER